MKRCENMKSSKRPKYRLKSSVVRFLIYALFFVSLTIYGYNGITNAIKEINYRDTYEYKLTSIGYSLEDTTKLISILKPERLEEILKEEKYNELYPNIINQKYFMAKNFEDYVTYKISHAKTSYEDTIAIVNVHADKGWYELDLNSKTEDGYLVLVNKFHHLNKNYKRTDLEDINLAYAYADNKAASIVIENFEQMHDAVLNELNIHLMVNSSYRPYEDQELIYNDYKNVSLKYADQYAARPGYSEHQTGLSLDITSLEHPGQKAFTESAEYEWLKNNAHKYGFILRYPENKDYITGYNTESWHFRYVGKDVATQIYNEKITFDEYYAYYIEK